MDKKSFFDILEVEEWDQVVYTEQIFTVFEVMDEVNDDLLFMMIDGMDKYTLKELLEAYLDDMLVGVPEDEVTLYGTLESIKTGVLSHVFEVMDDIQIEELANILKSFHQWLNEEKIVVCTDLNSNECDEMTMQEALLHARIEKLAEGKFEFKFPKTYEFGVDELPNDDFSDEVEISKDLIDEMNPVIEELE